jgi:hypothetical protein
MKYLFFAVIVVVLHLASAAYNPKMALEMGYMCAVAYNPVSQIASWTCPECMKYNVTDVSIKIYSGQSIHQQYRGHTRICWLQSEP